MKNMIKIIHPGTRNALFYSIPRGRTYFKVDEEDMMALLDELSKTAQKMFLFFITIKEPWVMDTAMLARKFGVTKKTITTKYRELQAKGFMFVDVAMMEDRIILGKKNVADYIKMVE